MLFAMLFQRKIYNIVFIVSWSQTNTKEFKNLQQISILVRRLHCLVAINRLKFLISKTFRKVNFQKSLFY